MMMLIALPHNHNQLCMRIVAVHLRSSASNMMLSIPRSPNSGAVCWPIFSPKRCRGGGAVHAPPCPPSHEENEENAFPVACCIARMPAKWPGLNAKGRLTQACINQQWTPGRNKTCQVTLILHDAAVSMIHASSVQVYYI